MLVFINFTTDSDWAQNLGFMFILLENLNSTFKQPKAFVVKKLFFEILLNLGSRKKQVFD